MTQAESQKENLRPRPPIVAVMGHVDHGKTSLLDYIRKANVAAREAGAITQAIGAYEITHGGKKITFIDTPGHEAFSKMRARGAKAADIVLLVVAADEGVKPQTKEAIAAAEAAKVPFIAVITKIDKPNADVERVKGDLASAGVLLEGLGGNVSWHAVSSKTGEGINELLDLITLAAEMENLTYNPESRAEGLVIESKADSRRGLTVSAIVKNGVLRESDDVVTASAAGKVKILENFSGKRVKEIFPSGPALIVGFEAPPAVGEEFFAGKGELARLDVVSKKPAVGREIAAFEKGVPALKIILKADTAGSLEAASQIIGALSRENLTVRILSQEIGGVSDGDVNEAASHGALLVGFKVGTEKSAENLAKARRVEIIASEVIYELVKALEEKIAAAGAAVSGELEILAIFGRRSATKQIVGGRVTRGAIKNNSRLSVVRDGADLGVGRVLNLQKQKEDTASIAEGEEGGLLFDFEDDVKVGDRLVARE